MEGGSPLLEYLTYGVLGLVAFALCVLTLRSAWFFLSLLAIPLAETVGRWRPFRGAVERWGERGAHADPRLWGARPPTDAGAESPTRRGSPRAVRLGMRLGALLGALPGLWLGVRDATRASTAGDAAWAFVMGLALLGGAGLLLGIALGAGAGVLIAASRRD
jgi:hypothetical protein